MRYHDKEATDTKREHTKLRQRNLYERRRAQGLVRVGVWIPKGREADIRSAANKLIGSEGE